MGPLQHLEARVKRPPLEILNAGGRSPITLICEHASNYVPAEYARLGLESLDLQRHIAWDIGAAEVTRALSRLLDAPAFLATYSRLLIDLNRRCSSTASIPTRSEATDIPGNQRLTPAERERRKRAIFCGFHEPITAHLDERERLGHRNIIVTIHSFTPVFLGKARPWHAGILFDRAAAFGRAMIERLGREASLNVGANVPYAVSTDEDYTLLVHGDQRGYPAILVEIRNDQIADVANAQAWARRLAAALRDVLALPEICGDRLASNRRDERAATSAAPPCDCR